MTTRERVVSLVVPVAIAVAGAITLSLEDLTRAVIYVLFAAIALGGVFYLAGAIQHKWWGFWLAVCLIGYFAIAGAKERELAKVEGTVVPGYEPTPLLQCRINPESFTVILGNNVFTNVTFPHVILQFGRRPVLTMERDVKGMYSITYNLVDDRGDTLVSATKSKYSRRLGVRAERSDKSHLKVYDHKDDVVFDFNFLNDRTIRISGVFRDPDSPGKAISIESGGEIQSGGTWSGTCHSSEGRVNFCRDCPPDIKASVRYNGPNIRIVQTSSNLFLRRG